MTRYLSLAEFWYLAEHVTGIDVATLIKASRVDLADSALHAPQASFDDTDFYPDPHDKAAVLACRIAWNHPLPDGNKRAAWACLVLFIELNDGSWNGERPDTDDALAVAARKVDEAWLADWLRERITFRIRGHLSPEYPSAITDRNCRRQALFRRKSHAPDPVGTAR